MNVTQSRFDTRSELNRLTALFLILATSKYDLLLLLLLQLFIFFGEYV